MKRVKRNVNEILLSHKLDCVFLIVEPWAFHVELEAEKSYTVYLHDIDEQAARFEKIEIERETIILHVHSSGFAVQDENKNIILEYVDVGGIV